MFEVGRRNGTKQKKLWMTLQILKEPIKLSSKTNQKKLTDVQQK